MHILSRKWNSFNKKPIIRGCSGLGIPALTVYSVVVPVLYRYMYEYYGHLLVVYGLYEPVYCCLVYCSSIGRLVIYGEYDRLLVIYGRLLLY